MNAHKQPRETIILEFIGFMLLFLNGYYMILGCHEVKIIKVRH